jgi:hypothetical protein
MGGMEEVTFMASPAKENVYQQPPTASGKAVEPSGPKGDDPSTAGPGATKVKSKTPENSKGHLNPSAPEDANTTPGSAGEK